MYAYNENTINIPTLFYLVVGFKTKENIYLWLVNYSFTLCHYLVVKNKNKFLNTMQQLLFHRLKQT